MIKIYKKEEQAEGGFNNGAILEKKPVGFPQDGGVLKPYSNLFYWAHAWSDNGSTIGLHPHQAFEIMTFVLEGEINHYDTKIEQWRKLTKGDVQIIKAGNGISHAERLEAKAEIFQIWFDPDIQKSIKKPAVYNDFTSAQFPELRKKNDKIVTYVGEDSPISTDSDIIIQEMNLSTGKKKINHIPRYITSLFLIHGEFNIEKNIIKKGDFLHIQNSDLEFNITSECRIFVIYNPEKLNYKTYAEQYL